MRFVLEIPKLQRLADVKVVTELWNQRDIRTQVAQMFKGNPNYVLLEEMEEMEEKVKIKVWALHLPQLVKEQLSNLIKPIGLQIIDWCNYHNQHASFEFLDVLLLNELRWTMRGTIDCAKTAEAMVKDERVDTVQRYEVACLNCLEDEAKELFQRLPDRNQRRLRRDWNEDPYCKLIGYFTCTFSGKMDQFNNYFRGEPIMQRLFALSLLRGNRATHDYLFNKLNQGEKERVLEERNMGFRGQHTCHLLYYFSLMKDTQQESMFRENVVDVLLCLLHWPVQSLFTEAAKCGWQLMNKKERTIVMSGITFDINCGFQDYDYWLLFRECWSLSPTEHKWHFMTHLLIFHDLFETKKEKFFKLVLQEAPFCTIEIVRDSMHRMYEILMDENAISDVALLEFKESAALESSNDTENVEKRSRSQLVGQLVDSAMERTI